MATLAAAIVTRLATLVDSKTLVDDSQTRDNTGTTQDADKISAAATDAAATVESYLGDSLTNSDAQALDIGTRLAMIRLNAIYPGTLADASVGYEASIHTELERLSTRRGIENADPVTTDVDYTDIDTRYPQTTWEDGD